MPSTEAQGGRIYVAFHHVLKPRRITYPEDFQTSNVYLLQLNPSMVTSYSSGILLLVTYVSPVDVLEPAMAKCQEHRLHESKSPTSLSLHLIYIPPPRTFASLRPLEFRRVLSNIRPRSPPPSILPASPTYAYKSPKMPPTTQPLSHLPVTTTYFQQRQAVRQCEGRTLVAGNPYSNEHPFRYIW